MKCLGFAGQTVSAVMTQLCSYSAKPSKDYKHEHSWLFSWNTLFVDADIQISYDFHMPWNINTFITTVFQHKRVWLDLAQGL